MKEEENDPHFSLLIKGLNSSEKSYYKKMSKRHANHNMALHLKLFKLIDESKVYDEEELCSTLKISKIHFSGLKMYLCKDILDTLVFEKRNTTIDTQLHFMQEQIRMLDQKKLLSFAQKLCKRAIELAIKYEKYHSLILLYHLQAQVLEFKDYKQYKSSTDLIFSNMQATINLQHLLAQNKLLYHQIKVLTQYSWLRIAPEEIFEIKKLKGVIETLKPATNIQPLIWLYYYNTLALCQYMLHENESCKTSCFQIFNLWNTFPYLINEYPNLFLNSVNTTSYNNFLCKNIPQAKENITAYSQLVECNLKNEFYRQHFEIIQFNTELKIYHKTAQYVQVKDLIDNQATGILGKTSELMSSPDKLSVMCSICISYFVLEQWGEAEALLTVVKELNRDINREDILYFSSLFYLLILYEKKEWYRLDYAIEAAYHYLYAMKKLRPFERKLILFLKRLFAIPSKHRIEILIKQFLEQLDKDEALDKYLYFHYFNYYGWLESKLKGMRYMDYNRQQVIKNSEEV